MDVYVLIIFLHAPYFSFFINFDILIGVGAAGSCCTLDGVISRPISEYALASLDDPDFWERMQR